MWIRYKHVLMNENLLDRVMVVQIPIDAQVRNNQGTVEVLVPEPGSTTSWWFNLDNSDSELSKKIDLAKSLLARANGVIAECFETKREKLQLLHDYLDIDFAELRRRS